MTKKELIQLAFACGYNPYQQDQWDFFQHIRYLREHGIAEIPPGDKPIQDAWDTFCIQKISRLTRQK